MHDDLKVLTDEPYSYGTGFVICSIYHPNHSQTYCLYLHSRQTGSILTLSPFYCKKDNLSILLTSKDVASQSKLRVNLLNETQVKEHQVI